MRRSRSGGPETESSARLGVAIGTSLVINAILWGSAGRWLNRPAVVHPPTMTFERVVIGKNHLIRRVIPKRPPEVKRPVRPPTPVHRTPPPPSHTPPPPNQRPAPPPPASHNSVVLAKPKNDAPPTAFPAPAGGDVKPGLPVTPGPAPVSPPVPTPAAPVAPSNPAPVEAKPAAPPTPAPVEAKSNKPAAPPPPPPEPPKPKGPTRDAEPVSTVSPEIPDSLKSDNLRAFVHVKVDVHADGSFDVVLRTSSRNPEVDKIVLDSLKRWKWKPALEEGEPVESTKLFRFEFEVK